MSAPTGRSPEPLIASGKSSEKLSLPTLQSKMKIDPEGYETELSLLYSQFNSALELFQQQSALNFTSSSSGICADPTIAKELGDRAMFLAHMTPFYPKQLANFPSELSEFLKSSSKSLPSGLRSHVSQALILLINRKMVDISETLGLFMELQTLGDRNLKKLAFSHVVHSIRRMNKKHKNDAKNRVLQNILFEILQQEDEGRAKRSLITLCELHRRKVWFDDRTANAICMACFHSSSRIMIAAMSFLLDFEKIEDDNSDDSDASSEDDSNTHLPRVLLSKEAVYKAHHKGTVSSKKKKKAKLQRAMRSMKRQHRLSSDKSSSNYYSPLSHLKDAQGFAERLLSRLQTCNERFEVKMMMLKLIARTVGLHQLILLNFYPFVQKYVQPHQRDITNLLAAAVQACHDMVPPDAVEPLFKQIVNQFVHDRSRPEAIAVGLNVIREICLRMPLLMTEDLLQDLVLYKKSHEKAISAAARSLMILFREVCPSLLIKKDRGRPIDPKAKPKAFGEVNVASNIPGVELLQHDDDDDDHSDNDHDESNGDMDNLESSGHHDDYDDETAAPSDDEENEISNDDSGSEDGDLEDDSVDEDDHNSVDENESDDGNNSIDENDSDDCANSIDESDSDLSDGDAEEHEKVTKGMKEVNESKASKRKFSDFDGKLIDADTSLRALKRLAEEKSNHTSSDLADGILSNEDFKRIKELKAKKEAKVALTRQGIKVPSSDQLSVKRVDPSKLEAHVRHKLSKEERLALVKAGREETGKYQARTAIKKKKTGGKSNRQKQHEKLMPSAARKARAERSRQEKKRKQTRSGKQFRGKKAWK
ncbi:protein SDA1 homolog [Ricinus communis]|uniref:Protein SDA1 n=1 Tax=Ricinus communis TaxID=3988 RepID=B9RMS4_RICCO|nr:protein SDA1 homolog [Ricinus communis]EEF47597.1 dentin sialophosphoprotein precursor, putative [Ricinus communis]|eukprot:XP_002515043.1 protein SDA1 homolog [Ricinus communis]